MRAPNYLLLGGYKVNIIGRRPMVLINPRGSLNIAGFLSTRWRARWWSWRTPRACRLACVLFVHAVAIYWNSLLHVLPGLVAATTAMGVDRIMGGYLPEPSRPQKKTLRRQMQLQQRIGLESRVRLHMIWLWLARLHFSTKHRLHWREMRTQ